jgi:hypothetical protein
MEFGVLPEDGQYAQLGNVDLPAGRHILARGRSGDTVVAWATTEPVERPGRVWAQLSAAHRHTGLVPFVLRGLEWGSTKRPWDNGEFSDPVDIAGLDRLDAARILRSGWAGMQGQADRDGSSYEQHTILARAPFGPEFPGLAPPAGRVLHPAEIHQGLDFHLTAPARIGLAVADRPADVLPLIGWKGHPSVLEAAAVLRSWEDRFGARLLEIGFAQIWLHVTRPPVTAEAAQRVAAELYSFGEEVQYGLRDLPSIALGILDAQFWSFWWD